MYVEDPDLDPYDMTIRLQVDNALALAQKLYVVVVERNSKKSLVIIGSDSCPKNTGQWAGVAAELEKLLKRIFLVCIPDPWSQPQI